MSYQRYACSLVIAVCIEKLTMINTLDAIKCLSDTYTVYVVIFEWLNFQKYGKLKISNEYHGIHLYSKYFRAAFAYLVASSLCVDPGASGGEAFCLNSVVYRHHIYEDI